MHNVIGCERLQAGFRNHRDRNRLSQGIKHFNRVARFSAIGRVTINDGCHVPAL